jgi:ABC-type sugar transport system permease subunit
MSTTTATTERAALPIPGWALPTFMIATLLFWLVTMEGGMVSQALGQTGSFLHELFHDGRHLLGVPCH